MLLTLMISCAIIAVILILSATFGELRDLWQHPEHKTADNPHNPHLHSRSLQ